MDPISRSVTPAQPTSMPHPTRRRLLAAALAVPLLLGAAACGGDDDSAGSGSNKKVELSIFWWGAQARADLTDKALALYTQKHPNVTFKKTWQANQGYYDKLATLTAGGNAPDIFQIDDNALAEYAGRGVTLDLTPYTQNGKLDVTKFPESLKAVRRGRRQAGRRRHGREHPGPGLRQDRCWTSTSCPRPPPG